MQCRKYDECGRDAEYGDLCLVHEKARRKRVAAAEVKAAKPKRARSRRGPRTPTQTTEAVTQTTDAGPVDQ